MFAVLTQSHWGLQNTSSISAIHLGLENQTYKVNFILVISSELGHAKYFKIGILSPNL